MGFSFGYFKRAPGLLKIGEIITVVIAFCFFRGSNAVFKPEENANYFGGSVLVTALIITPLLTACYVMERFEIQKTIFEIVYNFLMFLFLLIAGSMAVDFFKFVVTNPRSYKTNSMIMGCFCISSSIIYLADTACAVYLYRK